MANDAYTKELRKIMSDKRSPRPSSLTRAEIETAIAEISAQLKAPLSNVERLCLVEDRQELRKILAQSQAA